MASIRALLEPMNIAGASLLAYLNILWGAWVAMPMWDALSISGAHIYFIPPMLEPVVGVIAFVIGVMVLIGFARRKFRMLTWGSMGSFILWIVMTMCILYTAWFWASWILTFIIACYSGFVWVNIKVNFINLHDKR